MNTNKRTVLEFVFIICLLMIFGFTTFSLLYAGSQSYESLSSRKEVHSEVRMASSYINMKIRQNDEADRLVVMENPYNHTNALRIKELYDGITYYTWIYFDQGQIWEATLEEGMDLTLDMSFPIATLDNFSMSENPQSGLIETTVMKYYKDTPIQISTKIRLRTSEGSDAL